MTSFTHSITVFINILFFVLTSKYFFFNPINIFDTFTTLFYYYQSTFSRNVKIYFYSHKSYLDLSMFGILHLDCEGGKQGNYPFFGFPLEEKETGGKVGLSFETAQKNCKAQSWIFPTVFGLGKIILMLYHKYIFDQVENNQKAQRCRLSCVPLLGRCLSQKTSEWVNNRILLNPCLTPIMFLVQSIMIYCFVYY